MTNKYLKPMLDAGSPRVFNCNQMSLKLLAQDPTATLFFKNRPLNMIVLIKDTVPEPDRKPNLPSVGTKLYFPFNELNIYEGGRTIFLHDPQLVPAMLQHFGESALNKETLEDDLRVMRMLNKLPSLDPFLLKDIFIRNQMAVNEIYFEVSEDIWHEIELFMLQRFEPLVRAAFPDCVESDDKARQLIDKIWEARDIDALQPLIDAFRLPQYEALDIFSSWRGIVYYSFEYQNAQPRLVELIRWLKDNEGTPVGVTNAEGKEMMTMLNLIREQIRAEWQKTEEILRDYQDSYDKMFKLKVGSADFLRFLKSSNKTYWELGNALGKTSYAVYCWDALSSRFKDRKLPWLQLVGLMKMLSTILQPEKKTTTNMAW